MDKFSRKVLKYISKKRDVPRKEIVSRFGDMAKVSIDYLKAEKYISSGSTFIGTGPDMRPVLGSNGIYNITSKGIAFLEERPGQIFDKWLTRVIAIWGAITGTAAIALEIWLHFPQ